MLKTVTFESHNSENTCDDASLTCK